MKLGGESHIYSPPKVGLTALSAATFPDSCRAHRRQVSRVMAWRHVATGVTPLPHQLRLQDSANFGSKFGYLSRKAPRVRCPTHVGSAAGGANFAAVTPPPPPPIPTNDQIMGDLRDATLQYVRCADPTESAARKRRGIQGEEKGLMAETASIMLEAVIVSNQTYLTSEETDAQQTPSLHKYSMLNQDLPIHPAELTTIIAAPAKKKKGDIPPK
ncbi:hypothetical protein ISN45_At02g005150 [Arabidopsis thaliana x Arabidopsis arenosa]|uniref:Uncharacterized protein n=1 Tax=Arabidopsis thaliana x Arabidopsis arenosa TaxID=1240361 RepID=A0A8T2FNE5_9BRAS|nr:hypothetical protein ISN45_At02g005150 [Arabidopsis thaliana x Arabidopsis arenosa]